eukprot:COSAG01_NODE_2563_length_7449_cov_10.912517_7_plen_195_part_00
MDSQPLQPARREGSRRRAELEPHRQLLLLLLLLAIPLAVAHHEAADNSLGPDGTPGCATSFSSGPACPDTGGSSAIDVCWLEAGADQQSTGQRCTAASLTLSALPARPHPACSWAAQGARGGEAVSFQWHRVAKPLMRRIYLVEQRTATPHQKTILCRKDESLHPKSTGTVVLACSALLLPASCHARQPAFCPC